MEEFKYLTFTLNIPKYQFIWVHEHHLLNAFIGAKKETLNKLKKNTPNVIRFQFGGKKGTQFRELSEVNSFNAEFNKLLDLKKINKIHRDPLLYIMSFLNQDFEKQSQEINIYKELQESINFIVDLINMCSSHIDVKLKDEAYTALQDPYTEEFFFVKKELQQSMLIDDLVEYYIETDSVENVIRYNKVNILGKVLYVPKELIYSISSGIMLKKGDGVPVQELTIPARIQEQLFQFTLDAMLDVHKTVYKKYKTEYSKHKKAYLTEQRRYVKTKNINGLNEYPTKVKKKLQIMSDKMNEKHRNLKDSFYHLLLEFALPNSTVTLREFNKLYQKSENQSLNTKTSLKIIGEVVTDYLKHYKLCSSNNQAADFLFKYFALFKVFETGIPSTPTDYTDIYSFYIDRKYSAESVRSFMKDVWAKKNREKLSQIK